MPNLDSDITYVFSPNSFVRLTYFVTTTVLNIFSKSTICLQTKHPKLQKELKQHSVSTNIL